ncbi:50S ribosomal protein L30 [Atopobacter sp. AH10]|uniref:50S ribosomal protein L30 n=1 Tax=Atopobacter sp. AH10 TaxID=2315861 RepID=UPI000EF1C3C1|nr:50S ribosomal protein L30 [Atopobacter sp. AH10]RLK63833.1 50S ribosomal protein L30 [Atopobacter sp. AH10]
MAQLKITLKKSLIARPQNQIRTAKALGLTKIGKTAVRTENDAIKGMIRTISHLVSVEEV